MSLTRRSAVALGLLMPLALAGCSAEEGGGAQAEGLGLTDYFYGDGVCLVEWAQNIADVLPENCKTVTIEKLKGSVRKIIY